LDDGGVRGGVADDATDEQPVVVVDVYRVLVVHALRIDRVDVLEPGSQRLVVAQQSTVEDRDRRPGDPIRAGWDWCIRCDLDRNALRAAAEPRVHVSGEADVVRPDAVESQAVALQLP